MLKKFFKTVAIVTLFSICEKFLGFIYRIFLSRSIGSEGIGIYQVALSVFALLLTVCVDNSANFTKSNCRFVCGTSNSKEYPLS